MSRLEELSNSLFGEMRDMTPEESEAHNRYISSISTPTGVNIWDLVDNGNAISKADFNKTTNSYLY